MAECRTTTDDQIQVQHSRSRVDQRVRPDKSTTRMAEQQSFWLQNAPPHHVIRVCFRIAIWHPILSPSTNPHGKAIALTAPKYWFHCGMLRLTMWSDLFSANQTAEDMAFGMTKPSHRWLRNNGCHYRMLHHMSRPVLSGPVRSGHTVWHDKSIAAILTNNNFRLECNTTPCAQRHRRQCNLAVSLESTNENALQIDHTDGSESMVFIVECCTAPSVRKRPRLRRTGVDRRAGLEKAWCRGLRSICVHCRMSHHIVWLDLPSATQTCEDMLFGMKIHHTRCSEPYVDIAECCTTCPDRSCLVRSGRVWPGANQLFGMTIRRTDGSEQCFPNWDAPPHHVPRDVFDNAIWHSLLHPPTTTSCKSITPMEPKQQFPLQRQLRLRRAGVEMRVGVETSSHRLLRNNGFNCRDAPPHHVPSDDFDNAIRQPHVRLSTQKHCKSIMPKAPKQRCSL